MDKRFKSENISIEKKTKSIQKAQFYEKRKDNIREMHIAHIQESELWSNEMSILFGVIGVIALGKISDWWTCRAESPNLDSDTSADENDYLIDN